MYRQIGVETARMLGDWIGMFTRIIVTILLTVIIDTTALCALSDEPAFEVASVKPTDHPGASERQGCTGGPGGGASPVAWRCGHTTLANLIFLAYDLDLFQYTPPEWMTSTYFTVAAKVSPGASKSEFRLMQQNLLKERFKLIAHWAKKETTVFELTVTKDGPKLRESSQNAAPPEVEWRAVPGYKVGSDHYPIFPAAATGLMGINNYVHWRSANVGMPDLVRVLRRLVGYEVVDATGLTGRYDVDLYCQLRSLDSSATMVVDEPVEKVLPEQLGLRLQSRKGVASIFVIDHIERTPTIE